MGKVGRPIKRQIKLKANERCTLKELLSHGRESVRVIKRAQVLQIVGTGKSVNAAPKLYQFRRN